MENCEQLISGSVGFLFALVVPLRVADLRGGQVCVARAGAVHAVVSRHVAPFLSLGSG